MSSLGSRRGSRLLLAILVAAGVGIAAAWARAPRLQYLELVTAGADPGKPLPMVVAIHGLGDRPDHFVHLFDGYPRPARVILPRAPTPFGDGYAWFPFRVRDQNEEQLSAGIESAADKVAELIEDLVRERPTVGQPVIVGFSQGGMTAFAVAAKSPHLVSAALPIGGLLPPRLFPSAGKHRASIPIVRAFHGESDPAVPLVAARRAIQAFQAAGYTAALLEYPRTGHVISAEMRADFMRTLSTLTSTISR